MQEYLAHFLNTHSHFLPVTLWTLILVIVGGTFSLWLHMKRQADKTIRAAHDLDDLWAKIMRQRPGGDRAGLSQLLMDTLRESAQALPDLQRGWWNLIDRHLAPYGPVGGESWYLSAPLRDVLPEDGTTLSIYDQDFHQSAPGMIAGFGLLVTFLAILLGLLGVHIDPVTNSPTGVPSLIDGLSGKFGSSVVALLSSTIFVFFEKKWYTRKVRRAYEGLIRSGEAVLPLLTSAHILSDLHRESVKQSTSLSNISSDLVERFTAAFNQEIVPALGNAVSDGMSARLQEELRPTMQQMGQTLDDLRTAIERTNAQKQESIVGELHGVIEGLQSSLVNALGEMSRQFRDALTGAAREEFGGVEKTLTGTTKVLGEMNGQFISLQAAMRQLIERAEQSATRQADVGREQVEGMTAIMNGLMIRLQETADHNVRSLTDQLTAVAVDLSHKVGDLSDKMITAIDETARSTQQNTNSLIEKTGEWTESTSRRLEALVDSIQQRSEEFREAGQVLVREHQTLQQTIVQNHQALQGMADAAREVQTYSAALSGQGKALQQSEERHLQTVKMVQEAAGQFTAILQEQNRLVQEYRARLHECSQYFETLDERLESIFEAIHKGMQDYTVSVKNNFDAIVNAGDKMLPQIAQTLQGQIQGLEEQLEELGRIFGEGVKKLHATSR